MPLGTTPGVHPSTAAIASSPKLLDCVRWHLRVKHYSIRTEEAYIDWIRRYILFHRKCQPNEMGEQEITELLTNLAIGAAQAPGRFHDHHSCACSQQTRPRHPKPA